MTTGTIVAVVLGVALLALVAAVLFPGTTRHLDYTPEGITGPKPAGILPGLASFLGV